MKDNILMVLAVVILATMWFQYANQNTNNRYAVITGSNMMTVLLDKKTGVTWRNCICDTKSNIPGCWERMYTLNAEDYSKPIGEVVINKKLIKDLEKQAKQAPAQPAQPQTQTPAEEQK